MKEPRLRLAITTPHGRCHTRARVSVAAQIVVVLLLSHGFSHEGVSTEIEGIQLGEEMVFGEEGLVKIVVRWPRPAAYVADARVSLFDDESSTPDDPAAIVDDERFNR